MKKKYKLIAGFTLVEIMISVGLVGGVGLALMKIVSDTNKTSKFSGQVSTIIDIMNNISLHLQDRSNCEGNLKGLKDGDSITEIKKVISKGPPVTWGPLFEVGKTYGEASSTIVIGSINLKKQSTESSVLEVKFVRARADTADAIERSKLSTYGNLTITKNIAVETIYDPATGEIDNCKTNRDENVVEFCDSIDGESEGLPDSRKCRNINISKHTDKAEPSITSENYVHIKGGLAIGSAYTSIISNNPGNIGNVSMGGDLMLNGDIIFYLNDLNNDARIIKSGNDLHIYEKSGNNIQLGRSTPFLYRINGTGFGVNQSSPESGYDLDVNGAVSVGKKIKLHDDGVFLEFTGSTFKVILPSDWSLEINGGQNNNYGGEDDPSKHNRVATKEWVRNVLGKALAGDSASLDEIITAALAAASDQSLVDIRKSICSSSTYMKWFNNKCEMKAYSVDCSGSNKSIQSFDLSTGVATCTTITTSSIGAANNKHGNSEHNPRYALKPHGNESHNPDFEPTHTHPYAASVHGNESHNPPFALQSHGPQ